MPPLLAPYISQANYVLQFKSPNVKIRFDQGSAEEAFQQFMGVQSQQTNVPDSADPNMPRIVFGTDRKQVAISQINCQLNFNFTDTSLGIEKQLDIISKNVVEFNSCAKKFKSEDGYGITALVFQLNYPSTAPILELQEYIYGRLISAKPFAPVASAQVQLGYRVDDHFLNVVANVYEKRSINIQLKPEATVNLMPVDEFPLTEYGIGLRVEVNNKPAAAHLRDVPMGDPATIFRLAKDLLQGHLSTLMGLELPGEF